MAIKTIPVPFCDQCDEPWLPKHLLADGTPNPIFEHPEDSKRCGKCKSTRWNAGGVDRRRKAVAQDSDAVVVVPGPSFTKEEWTKLAQEPESPMQERQEALMEAIEIARNAPIPMPEVPAEAFQYLQEMTAKAQAITGCVEASARCRHGLYACPECHPQETQ